MVGALSLRTKGVYFIMVTLAFAQMAYFVIHDTPLGGGTDGIYLYIKPVLGSWLDLDAPLVLYGFTLACLVAVFGFLALLLRSRFGRALAGIRVNEQRMRATGFSTYPYKLAAFVISGGIAGLAGFLFAVKDGYVNPEMLSWHLSGAVLIMIILGGLGHLRGALIGAFAFALLQEFFKSEAVFGDFAKHWHLGLGLTHHRQRGAAAARPGRAAGAVARAAWPRRAGDARKCTMSPPEVLLRGRDITRRWGGLVAVDEVSIELARGQVHAVIGTNGAGKSTLINILSGEIPPSGGARRTAGPGRHRAGRSRAARAPAWAAATSATPSTRASACSRTAAWRRRPRTRSPGAGGATRSAAKPAPAPGWPPRSAPGWTTC